MMRGLFHMLALARDAGDTGETRQVSDEVVGMLGDIAVDLGADVWRISHGEASVSLGARRARSPVAMVPYRRRRLGMTTREASTTRGVYSKPTGTAPTGREAQHETRGPFRFFGAVRQLVEVEGESLALFDGVCGHGDRSCCDRLGSQGHKDRSAAAGCGSTVARPLPKRRYGFLCAGA